MKVIIKEIEPSFFEIWIQHPILGESPAGNRLIKGNLIHEIEFSFFDKTEAESNRFKLQKHIDEWQAKRR